MDGSCSAACVVLQRGPWRVTLRMLQAHVQTSLWGTAVQGEGGVNTLGVL